MRELTDTELAQVNGGIDWGEGGLAIIALGMMSPVTAGFGLGIGLSMLVVDVVSEINEN